MASSIASSFLKPIFSPAEKHYLDYATPSTPDTFTTTFVRSNQHGSFLFPQYKACREETRPLLPHKEFASHVIARSDSTQDTSKPASIHSRQWSSDGYCPWRYRDVYRLLDALHVKNENGMVVDLVPQYSIVHVVSRDDPPKVISDATPYEWTICINRTYIKRCPVHLLEKIHERSQTKIDRWDREIAELKEEERKKLSDQLEERLRPVAEPVIEKAEPFIKTVKETFKSWFGCCFPTPEPEEVFCQFV